VGREYSRNEAGFKQTIQVKLDGVVIERPFRNRGEAIQYLQRTENLTKQEINKRVRFIHN
jgi:hypothetical protein